MPVAVASIGTGSTLPRHGYGNGTGAVVVLDGAVREVGEVGSVPGILLPRPRRPPLLLPQMYHSQLGEARKQTDDANAVAPWAVTMNVREIQVDWRRRERDSKMTAESRAKEAPEDTPENWSKLRKTEADRGRIGPLENHYTSSRSWAASSRESSRGDCWHDRNSNEHSDLTGGYSARPGQRPTGGNAMCGATATVEGSRKKTLARSGTGIPVVVAQQELTHGIGHGQYPNSFSDTVEYRSAQVFGIVMEIVERGPGDIQPKKAPRASCRRVMDEHCDPAAVL